MTVASVAATAPTAATTPVLPKLTEGAAEPIPGSMSFQDFLAGLNPLHHLPVVGTIYRAVTGENIQPVMRVLGGALMGGPAGMLSAAVMAAIDEFRAVPAATPAPAPSPPPTQTAARETRNGPA